MNSTHFTITWTYLHCLTFGNASAASITLHIVIFFFVFSFCLCSFIFIYIWTVLHIAGPVPLKSSDRLPHVDLSTDCCGHCECSALIKHKQWNTHSSISVRNGGSARRFISQYEYVFTAHWLKSSISFPGFCRPIVDHFRIAHYFMSNK